MWRLRGMDFGTCVRAVLAGWRPVPRPRHVFFCVADHFEPNWQNAPVDIQRERVARWVDGYERSVRNCSDSRGRAPQHTFFFPMECYQPEWIDQLSHLVRHGLGDVEVHLHHDEDSAERLRAFLLEAAEKLHHRHGLLSKDAAGLLRYGFIHGNWALDNSHPDGRWCGVNNELTILRETGCYADFTLPAAPHPAQTRIINSIYYAIDEPVRPKSHDRGIPAAVGVEPVRDGLLLIQGPLLIRQSNLWSKPRLENGNIAASQPPSLARLEDWLRAGVTVQGRPDWLFIKLYTHGAQEKNSAVLLGPSMQSFHQALREQAARLGFSFYYVTAREMAQLVAQAEQGAIAPSFEQLAWQS